MKDFRNSINPFFGFFEDGDGTPPVVEGQPPEAKFTQEHVNSLVAKERKEWQGKLKKTEETLAKALTAKGLTETQRLELQTQLEEVQGSMRSKEEQIEHERTEMARKHKEALDTTSAELSTWKDRYTKSSIQREILDGAIGLDAYDPEQMVGLLSNHTVLADEIDEKGKKTGNLVPRTTFEIPDKDGKVEKISGSPREIIDKMSKAPKKFGNLFKNKSTGGIGAPPNAGTGNTSDLAELVKDPEKYREARRKGNIPGLKPTGHY